MCGRYTLSRTEEIMVRSESNRTAFILQARFNVCPTDHAAGALRGPEPPRFDVSGSYPVSGRKKSEEPRHKCADRRDTQQAVVRKPIRYNRCLIPATGFYEWKKEPVGKTPITSRR